MSKSALGVVRQTHAKAVELALIAKNVRSTLFCVIIAHISCTKTVLIVIIIVISCVMEKGVVVNIN